MITIVIPTYNEAKNITKLLDDLFRLDIHGLNLVVVDDNSPDGTGTLVEEKKADFPGKVWIIHRKEKLGLGSAYKEGFVFALKQGADLIIQMDADFSHPVDKILELVETTGTSHCVIGSRYIPGGSVDENWPFWRKGLSAFGNLYARTILDLPIWDVTGGFRIWRNETLAQLPFNRIRSNGYAFQIETAYVAYLQGCIFSEIPIYFADRNKGDSKMSLRIQLEAAIRIWWMLYQYRDLRRLKSPKG
jgi:dolichol-phosphate mannosyltransferase